MRYPEKDIIENYQFLLKSDDIFSFKQWNHSLRNWLKETGLPITIVDPSLTPEEIERKISEKEKDVNLSEARKNYAQLQDGKIFIGSPEDKRKQMGEYLASAGKALTDLDPTKSEAQITQILDDSVKYCHLMKAREHYKSILERPSSESSWIIESIEIELKAERIEGIEMELKAANATIAELDPSKSKEDIDALFKGIYVQNAREDYERIKGYNKTSPLYHHSCLEHLKESIAKAEIDIQELEPGRPREEILREINHREIEPARRAFANLATRSSDRSSSIKIIREGIEKFGHEAIVPGKSLAEVDAELTKYEPKTFAIPELRSWQYLPLINGKSYITSGQYLVGHTFCRNLDNNAWGC
jgi:hypothetical protein